MPRSIFEPPARAEVLDRIGKLSPQSTARWGKLSVERVVPHMADQIRMALGDIPIERASGPLRFPVMRYLLIHVLPWPKGRAEAPQQAFTTSPSQFETDRGVLRDLVERIGERAQQRQWPPNPVFGALNARDWGVLTYRHLDHHLRQFGA